MKANITNLNYVPEYNDNYLRYLQTLADEGISFNGYNDDNIASAKVTLKNINKNADHNRKVYQEIREGI